MRNLLSRCTPGNGLGLSLVAAVARLQEARITLLDNAPGLKVELQFPGVKAVKSAPEHVRVKGAPESDQLPNQAFICQIEFRLIPRRAVGSL